VPSSSLTVDRRAALKARHRQAIVDAARRLIDAHQGPRFSVDELAAEADVSRRTVFNHFESLDDVILAACTEILDAVVSAFREAATGCGGRDGDVQRVFGQIVQAVRTTDLPQLTAYLWSALGGADAPPARQQRFMQVALSRVADDLTLEVLRRNPGIDPLDAELLVSSILHGIAVISRRWIEEFGGSTTSTARRAWDVLVDRLVLRLRTGYGAIA
jgi:TetR/AcrR family transcriptional regulator, regulator of autoinduction and epiphytic fitness